MGTDRDRPMMSPPRGKFSERLAYYLVGIAIGLVMVGLLMRARQRAMGPPPEQPTSAETAVESPSGSGAESGTEAEGGARREETE